jgi:hypothetical protein
MLDVTSLSDSIHSAMLENKFSDPGARILSDAIAKGIVDHFKANLQLVIPPGLIQVQGSPAAQMNSTPIVVPPGSFT